MAEVSGRDARGPNNELIYGVRVEGVTGGPSFGPRA